MSKNVKVEISGLGDWAWILDLTNVGDRNIGFNVTVGNRKTTYLVEYQSIGLPIWSLQQVAFHGK